MLAVLVRVTASVLSICFFLSTVELVLVLGPLACAARARFCWCCFSFLATRALRSSRAILAGSWSMSVRFVKGQLRMRAWRKTCIEKTGEGQSAGAGTKPDGVLTGIGRNLCKPLHFLVLVRTLPSPTVNPLLFLLVPDLLVPPRFLDTLCFGELLPFGWRLRFRQRLLARKLGRR